MIKVCCRVGYDDNPKGLNMDFKVVPLNLLPSELKFVCTERHSDEEKNRETILSQINAEIAASNVGKPEHERALPLLRALGSDLNINAFAVNFRL